VQDERGTEDRAGDEREMLLQPARQVDVGDRAVLGAEPFGNGGERATLPRSRPRR
jgi:hypothetical protein